MSYTTGKWEAIGGEVTSGERLVANCRGYSDGTHRTFLENQDNAQLIAAAPEMYEALKVAERWCTERLDNEHVDLMMIRSALAKADGLCPHYSCARLDKI